MICHDLDLLCCGCDEPATLRCPACKEWHCLDCFGGPERADADGPCSACAQHLAQLGIY
jgi:hypothetical protein